MTSHAANSGSVHAESVRARLRARCARTLVDLGARSVLDVGCGGGGVVANLLQCGVAATGVERKAEVVERARATGLDVLVGDAEQLDFADASFDWVLLRHVLHHLARPRQALAEAWRVARCGVVAAEPALDLSLAHDRVAERADRLLDRLAQAGGHEHEPALDAGQILDGLPSTNRGTVEILAHHFVETRPRDWFAGEVASALSDVADEALRAELLREFASIQDEERRHGLGATGSRLVIVRRVAAVDS